MIGIYKIVSPSGKVYIGQSWDIEKRWYAYKSYNCEDQPKLFNSLKKYGSHTHTYSIIKTFNESISQEELNLYEYFYIEYYRSYKYYMLNIRIGGNSGKLLPGNKGAFFGRKHSEETKQIMAEKAKGRFFSEETRRKIGISSSIRNKGHNAWNKGVPHTEEARLKMSESRKGKRIKAVNRYSKNNIFIDSFSSIKEAAAQTGVSASKISCVCNNKRNHTGGYIWKFS